MRGPRDGAGGRCPRVRPIRIHPTHASGIATDLMTHAMGAKHFSRFDAHALVGACEDRRGHLVALQSHAQRAPQIPAPRLRFAQFRYSEIWLEAALSLTPTELRAFRSAGDPSWPWPPHRFSTEESHRPRHTNRERRPCISCPDRKGSRQAAERRRGARSASHHSQARFCEALPSGSCVKFLHGGKRRIPRPTGCTEPGKEIASQCRAFHQLLTKSRGLAP